MAIVAFVLAVFSSYLGVAFATFVAAIMVGAALILGPWIGFVGILLSSRRIGVVGYALPIAALILEIIFGDFGVFGGVMTVPFVIMAVLCGKFVPEQERRIPFFSGRVRSPD